MREENLTVKIQIRLTEEEKQNMDKDIPLLARQVRGLIGRTINRSDFLRTVLDDLHQKILASKLIAWPPSLEVESTDSTRKIQMQSIKQKAHKHDTKSDNWLRHVGIRIPLDQIEALDKLAEASGGRLKRSDLIRQAIDEFDLS